MHVAVDISIPSRTTTGVGVYAQDLLDSLRGRPLDLHVWRCRLGPPHGRLTRLVNGARLAIWHQLRLRRRIAAAGIDVYHSACAVGPIGIGCPVVMTVHDATLWLPPNQYGAGDRAYHRVFSVLAARRAAAVIVPSQASRDEVARTYRIPRERLHVVPYGVSPLFAPTTSEQQEEVRRRHGLARPYVLCVGAEPPRKNLPRTVDAFARAVARCRDATTELVLAGPAEPRDAQVDRVAARLGITGRVRRLGPVPRHELPALYGAASCLAYVSLREGFGFPIVEAMACGTSVLTSRSSSMAEVAGDAAVLVDPTDVEAMADALTRLICDPEFRKQMAARGPARAGQFSWARTAALTEATYRAVLGRA